MQELEEQVAGSEHEEPRRIDGATPRLKRWWAYLRGAPRNNISAWETSLLSRYKITRLTDVVKMRQPVKPTTTVTWYR